MTAQDAWEAVLGELQLQISKANFTTWLKPTKGISYDNNVFLIGVPNSFVGEWLEKRWHSLIKKTLASILGRDLQIKFQVGASCPDTRAVSPLLSVKNGNDAGKRHGLPPPALSPKYTFDNFVVYSSNCLAHAAAVDVAREPAKNYNPLFIYAGSGLGKTHLLQAIGHAGWAGGYDVLYTSGEQFTNEFVNSLRNHTFDDFRLKYRSPDILLMDDVQFLCGKDQTQENFFYAFNDLYNASRQIVLCSDRPPKSLPHLEERLLSRFEGGILVNIESPDCQARLAIIQAKAEKMLLPLPNDALEAIARTPFQNVRELEGCLNKVAALAKLSNQAPTAETVRQAIPEILVKSPAANVSPKKILEQVAAHHNTTPKTILAKKRDRSATLLRYIALYLIREQCQLSFADISDILGYKDHTSTLYGYNKIAAALKEDDLLRQSVDKIVADLQTPQRS